MSESRRVLAVDEQRATLEFLRSILPMVNGERFEIVRVFSAEEGLLELRRKPYDLLITGLRLPGMDGLDLCHRAKRLRPELGVILATGRPLAELRDQATAAGVDHLLHKPLDGEEFLTAVQAALAATPPATRQSQSIASEEPEALPSAVSRRLETLCDETGAGQVILATVAGEIVYVTGGQLHRDIPHLVAVAAASVNRALDLSRQMNEGEPKAVQFVEGTTTDVYWANVGRDYFVAILFDAQLRRGRIGTVWVFTQRAVGELKRLLAGRAWADTPAAATPVVQAETRPAGPSEAEPVEGRPAPAGARPAKESGRTGEAVPATAAETGVEKNGSEEPARSAEDLALDDYWAEALATEAGQDAFGAGISLEEAKAKGLVANDFDPDRWRDDAGS